VLIIYTSVPDIKSLTTAGARWV